MPWLRYRAGSSRAPLPSCRSHHLRLDEHHVVPRAAGARTVGATSPPMEHHHRRVHDHRLTIERAARGERVLDWPLAER